MATRVADVLISAGGVGSCARVSRVGRGLLVFFLFCRSRLGLGFGGLSLVLGI